MKGVRQHRQPGRIFRRCDPFLDCFFGRILALISAVFDLLR